MIKPSAILLISLAFSSALAAEPVADTAPTEPVKKPPQRICNLGQKCYTVEDTPEKDHDGHKHRSHYPQVGFPVYINTPVYTQPVISQIDDSVKNDEMVLGNDRVVLTNLWRGMCSQTECTVSAGYLAADPMTGIILLSQPVLNTPPLIIATPKATGPIVIREMNTVTGILRLESLSDWYALSDVSGKPILENNFAKKILTPGNATYYFNTRQAKFTE